MIRSEEILIRPIRPADLDGAMRLSSEQGWNQTASDWLFMIDNPENCCLLASYHEKIIGTTTAINYNQDVVWISMVLVDKAFRGHGISKMLLEAILNKLTNCRSIKLDATPEGQRVYKGFHFKDEYEILRMTLQPTSDSNFVDDHLIPQKVRPEDLPELIAYDTAVFGANRGLLINRLYREYPHKAWLLRQDGKLLGFVFGRDGRRFNHIGPVMAETDLIARTMVSIAARETNDQPMVVDVLVDKPILIEWLTRKGFVTQRNFVRMYRHVNPFPGIIEHQYLICGPEFG